MSQCGSNYRSGQQHINQHVVKVGEKAQQRVFARRLGQAVGAVLRQPLRGFFGAQAFCAGVQRIQHGGGFLGMGGQMVGGVRCDVGCHRRFSMKGGGMAARDIAGAFRRPQDKTGDCPQPLGQ